MVRLLTWNVNSLNVRLERLLGVMDRHKPDIICLQELKCVDQAFPETLFQERGYHSVSFGQKAYNGVAVMSRFPLEQVYRGFQGVYEDSAARVVGAYTGGLWVASLYVPNGQDIGTEKFKYKLEWLAKAKEFFEAELKSKSPYILAGDFNIAPDDRDVYDPEKLREHLHCSTMERQALTALYEVGFQDLLRSHSQDPGMFSWWDYRNLSFPQNRGLRIDLILGTKDLLGRLDRLTIDREERKGERPSDHVPVILDLH